ncbi:MAG: membrane protein insertase YidC [Verrucomicrobia bacterium]|nr:membrane protein insertase YidC [Verrucomicrobiota bacterium]
MDRKGIGILMVAFALMLGWPALVNRLYPPSERSKTATNAIPRSPSSNSLVGVQTGSTSSIPATTIQSVPSSTAPPVQVLSATAGQTLVLENTQVRATFTSLGGGLRRVDLKEYPAVIARGKGQGAQASTDVMLNDPAFSPAFVHVGLPGLGGDQEFELIQRDGAVIAQKDLPEGLRVVKEYRLASNYVFQVTIRHENRGSQPVALPSGEMVMGTASTADRQETGDWLGAYWYNGTAAEHVDMTWFANRFMGCIPGVPRTEYVAGASNVAWAAVHNRFFTMIAIPDRPADRVVVRDFALPKPTPADRDADGRLNPEPRAYQASLVLAGGTVAPGQSLEQRFSFYAGPKEYFTLSRMRLGLEAVMDFAGFTGFFAKALLLSLNGLHQFIPSYGWAIVVLTILIKALFWPLTAISTRSMKRMQAIQPELQAIREKFKNDPAKVQEKTMECMKRHKVNPAAGCLPMLIQFPVFIGFFFMLRTAIELRGASFLWVANLAEPDTLFTIPNMGWVPFLGVAGVGLPFNLLPLLMGATSLWMSSLTPPSPQMDPVQQKMMKYMPVFFVAFLYNYSSGLTLYWTVQNLLSVLQTKITRMNDEKTSEKGSPPGPLARKKT